MCTVAAFRPACNFFVVACVAPVAFIALVTAVTKDDLGTVSSGCITPRIVLATKRCSRHGSAPLAVLVEGDDDDDDDDDELDELDEELDEFPFSKFVVEVYPGGTNPGGSGQSKTTCL